MNISVLDETKITAFQAMTETILEQTSFRVASAEILERAEKAGARVDRTGQVIRLPAVLLYKLLQKAPARYTVKGCDGREYIIGGGHQYVSAIVVDPWIISHPLFDYSGEHDADSHLGGSMWHRAQQQVRRMTKNDQSPVPQQVQARLNALFQKRYGLEPVMPASSTAR